MSVVIVRRGDTLSAIAFRSGTVVDRIWSDPRNHALRNGHRRPEQLCSGDIVHIPKPAVTSHKLRGGETNTFKVDVPLSEFEVIVIVGNEPLRHQRFLAFDHRGKVSRGVTDKDGLATISCPVTSWHVRLEFPEQQLRLHLAIGHLEPVHSPVGVRMRLILLGHYFGPIHGEIDDELRAAIRSFQQRHGLDDTGECNDSTRQALVEAVGS